MSHQGSPFVVAVLISGLAVGCGQVQEQARATRQQISTTTKNVRKNLKKIQLHGEVDLEVMAQLTAVSEAYQKYLETKHEPPQRWPDLEGVAAQASSVQEARRQGAFVRFGATKEQLADELRKSEQLIAIQSTNDNSIWAMNFNGDIVPLTETEFAALSPKD